LLKGGEIFEVVFSQKGFWKVSGQNRPDGFAKPV
jgi:hypothetical protein